MSTSSQDSNDPEMLQNLISATGISEDLISSELKQLTARAGIDPKDLTIEDLRQILADYVQEVLLSAKAEFDSKKPKATPITEFTPPLSSDAN